jgi:hypothetical protein
MEEQEGKGKILEGKFRVAAERQQCGNMLPPGNPLCVMETQIAMLGKPY